MALERGQDKLAATDFKPGRPSRAPTVLALERPIGDNSVDALVDRAGIIPKVLVDMVLVDRAGRFAP
jgi:hypothetical protein